MNTSIERLEQIELERVQTQSNPEYQNWVRELNVSRLHIDREGILRANEIMALWGDSSLWNKKSFSNLNPIKDND